MRDKEARTPQGVLSYQDPQTHGVALETRHWAEAGDKMAEPKIMGLEHDAVTARL